jgi:hypothetical protein
MNFPTRTGKPFSLVRFRGVGKLFLVEGAAER